MLTSERFQGVLLLPYLCHLFGFPRANASIRPKFFLFLVVILIVLPVGSYGAIAYLAQRRIIKERLRIFIFGNPSVDWKVKNRTEHSLSKYVNTTEHFANETDFAAMLRVVMHRDD